VSAITGNQIGDVGATALARALEANRTLTTLDLERALSYCSSFVSFHAFLSISGVFSYSVAEKELDTLVCARINEALARNAVVRTFTCDTSMRAGVSE
jgi:hypothetical protein